MSAMPGPAVGVLVMAHGTPSTPEGIEPFYTSIRGGRPPTPELLAELVGRYRAIGGTSPLAERTRLQVAGIAAALDASEPGRYVVRFGAKHTSPSIEDGVAELAGCGVDRVVALVLTPHQSALGSGQYLRRAADAAAGHGLAIRAVAPWHRDPELVRLLAERTAAARATLAPSEASRAVVLFTAHSLPERALTPDDPYRDQVGETASAVAAALGLDPGAWEAAFQSAGRTSDPWIGPDLLAEIDRFAAGGATAVLVCPVGFVADHLEVLYDLDVEAEAAAGAAGVGFARSRSLDDDPRFCALLARAVQSAAHSAEQSRAQSTAQSAAHAPAEGS